MLKYTFVCNTPYHVYISFILAKLIKNNNQDDSVFNLVLVGDILERYYSAQSSGTMFNWNCVTFLYGVKTAHFSPKIFLHNVYVLRLANKIARAYFNNNKVDFLFVFADNDAINTYYIRHFRTSNPNGKLVLVEEGIAAYTKPVFLKRGWKYFVKKTIKSLIGFPNPDNKPLGENSRPDFCIVSSIDSLKKEFGRGAQYIEWPRGPFPIEISLEFMHCYLQELDDYTDIFLYQQPLLLLTQPLSEDGLITVTQEYEYLRIVKRLAERIGKKIIIKPHPREKYEKINYYRDLGFEVLEKLKNIPVEIMLMLYQPKVVITVISSAAINYAMRNNGKVLWLEKIVMNGRELKNPLLDRLISDNKIYAPNNIVDLEELETYLFNDDKESDKTTELDWSKTIEHFL